MSEQKCHCSLTADLQDHFDRLFRDQQENVAKQVESFEAGYRLHLGSAEEKLQARVV